MAEGNGKSKLSVLLQDLRADLLRGRIEDVFEFAGRKFRMHTLSDGESVWRDMYVSTASNVALLSSMKGATVAAAISHVDDVPVQELFSLPEDPKLVDYLKNSSDDLRNYYRERMHEFMLEFGDAIINEFHAFYRGLDERRREVIEQLKNSSKGTRTSESSSTSSPADGPPAAPVAREIRGSSFSG